MKRKILTRIMYKSTLIIVLLYLITTICAVSNPITRVHNPVNENHDMYDRLHHEFRNPLDRPHGAALPQPRSLVPSEPAHEVEELDVTELNRIVKPQQVDHILQPIPLITDENRPNALLHTHPKLTISDKPIVLIDKPIPVPVPNSSHRISSDGVILSSSPPSAPSASSVSSALSVPSDTVTETHSYEGKKILVDPLPTENETLPTPQNAAELPLNHTDDKHDEEDSSEDTSSSSSDDPSFIDNKADIKFDESNEKDKEIIHEKPLKFYNGDKRVIIDETFITNDKTRLPRHDITAHNDEKLPVRSDISPQH